MLLKPAGAAYHSAAKVKYSPLQGAAQSFRASGPSQLVGLALLWEHLLRTTDQAKADRAEIRSATRKRGPYPVTPREWSVVRGETSDFSCPRALKSDEFWISLYGATAVQLDLTVHASLWAPFADRQTGQLVKDGLAELVCSVVPGVDYLPTVALRKLQEVASRVVAGSVPGAEYSTTKLRARVHAPLVEVRDDEGVLHSPIGPARVFADGTSVYLWRGMVVPTAWLPGPDEEWYKRYGRHYMLPRGAVHQPQPIEALRMSNVELRRCACEILGWDAVIDSLNPRVVDVNPDPSIGTLIAVKLEDPFSWAYERAQEEYFLRVQCGTGRWFSLAVPPTMRTALEANAWTYGLDPGDYLPEVRT